MEHLVGFDDLTIYVPSSVMILGDNVFCNCDTVYIEGKTSISDFESVCGNTSIKDLTSSEISRLENRTFYATNEVYLGNN